MQSVASAGNLLTGNQTLAQVIQGAKAPAKMAKVIQDYPEIGAILDGYQKGEYHNLTLSQEALQALADATGVSTEVLLTSITAQQGIQGGTNKVLTVIDTHDKLKADSIQTLAHELDHVREGKNETLANLAGLAAKLNTDAATLANQDEINPIKAQLGDGKDANTTALNQDLLERNDSAFFKDWVKNTEKWQYIIQTTDGQQLARHKMFNGTQKLVYDYLQENYPDAFKANDEDFYRLVSQAMKEVGISDSIFIPFIGNEYYEDDVLMNKKESQSRTDKNDIAFYKKVFIKHMRETDGVWSDEEFKKFTESDVYYYEKIQNGIATQKVIQAGLEKGLPLAQAALGVGEVIGGAAALSTCPSVAGCVVAIAIITDGVDNVATAFVNYNKPIEEQIASLGLQNLGVDEQNANLIKLGTGLGTSVSAIVIARNADRLVDGGGILSKSDINIEDVDLKTNIHADLPKVLDENPNVLADSTVSKNHMDMSANLEVPNVDIGQNHGGVSLKEHIQANIADSQKARKISRFENFSNSDKIRIIELESKAEKALLNEINQFPSKSKASNVATMIGAYDIKTGKIAVGHSNAQITADMLDKRTVDYIENKLNVKIGEFTSFCKNKVGACAEISAADQLIKQGVDPSSIRFTRAVRPQHVYGKDKMPEMTDGKANIETCPKSNMA